MGKIRRYIPARPRWRRNLTFNNSFFFIAWTALVPSIYFLFCCKTFGLDLNLDIYRGGHSYTWPNLSFCLALRLILSCVYFIFLGCPKHFKPRSLRTRSGPANTRSMLCWVSQNWKFKQNLAQINRTQIILENETIGGTNISIKLYLPYLSILILVSGVINYIWAQILNNAGWCRMVTMIGCRCYPVQILTTSGI